MPHATRGDARSRNISALWPPPDLGRWYRWVLVVLEQYKPPAGASAGGTHAPIGGGGGGGGGHAPIFCDSEVGQYSDSVSSDSRASFHKKSRSHLSGARRAQFDGPFMGMLSQTKTGAILSKKEESVKS